MPSLRFGDPVRVAFVGAETSVARHALHAPAGGLVPRFFDARTAQDAGDLAAALEAWGPHVVVALHLDPALAGTVVEAVPGAVTLGAAGDAGPFDRAFPGWRAPALPVDDRLYAAVRPSGVPPRALFAGASSEHREKFLIGAKHEYDLLHYAHGLHGDALREVLGRTDVAVALHEHEAPGFIDDVLVHLAAGQLVVSEPLTPPRGLEPGTDFLEIRRPDELLTTLYQLQRRPDAFERVRLRGRAKAEEHRASRVWPRLVGDLLAEVRGAQRSSASRGAARRNTA